MMFYTAATADTRAPQRKLCKTKSKSNDRSLPIIHSLPVFSSTPLSRPCQGRKGRLHQAMNKPGGVVGRNSRILGVTHGRLNGNSSYDFVEAILLFTRRLEGDEKRSFDGTMATTRFSARCQAFSLSSQFDDTDLKSSLL